LGLANTVDSWFCKNGGKEHSLAFGIPYAMLSSMYIRRRFTNTVATDCTGLPIKASADKLVKEVEMFGAEFERYKEEEETEAPASTPAPAAKGAKEDVTKFSAKKGKAAAKTIKMSVVNEKTIIE
jgi:hypothetical protein